MKIKTHMSSKLRRMAKYTTEMKTPVLHYLADWFNHKRYLFKKEKMEKELFHSCIVLKNLAIVYQEMPMSTDYILEQLMESSQSLKSVYADILTIYRSGRHDEAVQCLCQRVPLNSAQKFARILSRIDVINPAELISQMNAFEETFSAERKTRAMARAERKSLVTTLASTATIFVVLLNFVVVVVFLDTLQILSGLF